MDAFRAHVFGRGDRPALYRRAAGTRLEVLTWSRYGRAVREVTLGLVDAGVLPGNAVAVPGADTFDSFEARILDVAVQCAGAVRAPDAAPPASVADLAAAGADLDERAPAAFEERAAAVAPGDPAVREGGVTLSHANLLWAARAFTGAVPVTEEDRIMSTVPVVAHHVQLLTGAAAVVAHVPEATPTVEVAAARVWGPPEAGGLLTLDGRPLPGVTVAIGDDGEILARGPSIGTGPRVGEHGWLRTGTSGRVVRGRVVPA